MADAPGDVQAKAQSGAFSSPGSFDNPVCNCSGCINVEACFTDAWATPITRGPLIVESQTKGTIVNRNAETESLGTHGVVDGDTETAPLEKLGTFDHPDVGSGMVTAQLVSSGNDLPDAMDALGTTLTGFRDATLTRLEPYLNEWLNDGVLSVPAAGARGLGQGLTIWWQGESDFWNGVSAYAMEMSQASIDVVKGYLQEKTLSEKLMMLSPFGLASVLGQDLGNYIAGELAELFSDMDDLADYAQLIFTALKELASGVVDRMEAAFVSLKELPGAWGDMFAEAIEKGQDWIEAFILIASETNAFEYLFSLLGVIAMSMPPNFWAEIIAVGVGFLLPELIIELIIMLIVGLTGGTAFPALAARAGVFLAKLRKLAKTIKAADVLAEIVTAFKAIASGLARIGRALRKLLDDAGEAAAGGIARIRRQLNQYTMEIDPNTLGMNGGNIRITRKKRVFARSQQELDDLATDPAIGGKMTNKTRREREVGLALEEAGHLKGPIVRDPSGDAEFLDADGQGWDIKAFNSHDPPRKGSFDLQTDAGKIENALQSGENVILDTQNLFAEDLQMLKDEVASRGWGNRVLYY
ncbi:MAG: hypothetical protein AAGI03_00305 [Pseudomonadota bacterium]